MPVSDAAVVRALAALAGEDAMDPTLWAPGWPHEAPDKPLSITAAHQIWRRHSNCRLDCCPRKAAAIRTLRENGRLKPDGRMSEVCQ